MIARAALLLALAAAPAAAAEITARDRAACMPDVRRLCADALRAGDLPGGIACLVHNRDRLTAACRKVLADHGT